MTKTPLQTYGTYGLREDDDDPPERIIEYRVEHKGQRTGEANTVMPMVVDGDMRDLGHDAPPAAVDAADRTTGGAAERPAPSFASRTLKRASTSMVSNLDRPAISKFAPPRCEL